MSTHSAAPWVVDGPSPAGRNPNMGLWSVEGARNNVASDCTLADAHLIAAAPELLEALTEAVDLILQLTRSRWSEWEGSEEETVGDYRRILAKATPSDTHEVG